MGKIVVRMAANEEGEEIRALVSGSGFAPETIDSLDWSNVYPYWIVATDEDRIVGCLQVVVARPIARLEYLGFDDGLSKTRRALVTKRLLESGCAMLNKAGAQLASGTVPFKHYRGYMKILKRRGAEVQAQGTVFIRRVH